MDRKTELIEKLKDDHPSQRYFDCLSCGNSHSHEGVALYCIIQNRKVEEDDLCQHFN